MKGNPVEQEKLLQWLNMVSFAVNDIVLYLDTHPADQEAIAYFKHFREIRTKAATALSPSTAQRRKTNGSGPCSPCPGKEVAVKCGIMKNGCSTR